MKINKTKVCVIGMGYIGLPTALHISSYSDYYVTGVDINKKLINLLKNRKYIFEEKNFNKYFNYSIKKKKIKFTTTPSKSDFYFICVPTPLKKNNKANLSYVLNAIENIYPVLEENATIVIESTCPVGTTDLIKKKINLYFKNNLKFNLAYCPERVLPGNIFYELKNNDKIIGGIDQYSTKLVSNFFSKIVNGKIYKTTSKIAELCKIVENSYRSLNIAFANELSLLCHKQNININNLIDLANRHNRVDILSPSIGVGGHCIPIDPLFLYELDKKNTKLIIQASKINKNKTKWVIKQILSQLEDYLASVHKQKIKILCLGLAYKPNVGDLRESPALEIFNFLQKDKRFILFAQDPHIKHKNVSFLNLNKKTKKFDIIIKLVNHNLFIKKDFLNKYNFKQFINFAMV